MQFVKPQPFTEAVAKLGSKSIIGSKLLSEHWQNVPTALRERAFFSSRVESARFLQTARDSIADHLQSAVDPDSGALKTGSRADFVKQMQDFSVEHGLGTIGPAGEIPNDVTNLASERRLGLIFDTQTRQAQDYGYWQQGMDPDVLNAFPAQRFIRVRPVKEPRDMHQHHEGEVHLKTDLDFWTALNQDFGVPWGPWGWGCGHDVEDVDRAEAVQLGLIDRTEAVKPVEKDFNARLEASVQNLDPDLAASLQHHFGDQVTIEGDTARWKGAEVAPSVEALPQIPEPPQPDTSANRFVSEALTIVRPDPNPLHEAKALIDHAHHDGTLPRIPVHGEPSGRASGELFIDQELHKKKDIIKALSMAVRKTAHEKITFFHEVGHLLDSQSLGDPGQFASHSHPDLAPWRKAIQKTELFKEISEAHRSSPSFHSGYLLRWHELWARSYAQWIAAQTTENPTLSQAVRSEISVALDHYRKGSMVFQGGHWSDEDFAPVSEAITKLFTRKGWIPSRLSPTLPK